MSLWYLVALGAIVLCSWRTSELYTRRCRCTERHLSWHGALEFNLTFFALNFLLLWFITREREGAWFSGALGCGLLLILMRRFWRNWEKPGAPNE